MDKRVRERRRSISRERGRKRVGIVIALAGMVVVIGLFLWLRSSDVFAVKHVIATAVEHITEQQIAQATLEARGVSLLRLSTDAIERRLNALPYVRSAEVYRSFPSTLEVRLVEYEPAARLRATDGTTWLVSSDGRVLERKSKADLPLIVPAFRVVPEAGEELPEKVTAALPVVDLIRNDQVSSALPAVHHIAVSEAGQVTVVLDGETQLQLGDPTQLKRKLTVGVAIIQQYLRDEKPVDYVDVSVPDRVAVNVR